MKTDQFPEKYLVLAVTIVASCMLWLTWDDYNPAGAQPVVIFGALTILGWVAVVIAFTVNKGDS